MHITLQWSFLFSCYNKFTHLIVRIIFRKNFKNIYTQRFSIKGHDAPNTGSCFFNRYFKDWCFCMGCETTRGNKKQLVAFILNGEIIIGFYIQKK